MTLDKISYLFKNDKIQPHCRLNKSSKSKQSFMAQFEKEKFFSKLCHEIFCKNPMKLDDLTIIESTSICVIEEITDSNGSDIEDNFKNLKINNDP